MAPSNGVVTAAGILGIIAIVIAFIPFVDFLTIPLGITALIMGIVGVGRANRIGGHGKGMAVTGIVTGAVAIVLFILFIIVVYATIYGFHTTTTLP